MSSDEAMVPDIQEECPVKPEEEVEMEEDAEIIDSTFEELEKEREDELAKARLERLKSLFAGGGIFAILLQDVMKSVLEESKLRISEEMVRFRKSMAEQLRNSEHGDEEEVDLLKMNGSFRAAWNKWLSTPNDRKAEEAFKVFESCLFVPETDSDEEMDEDAER